jgi:hypothetical protein
MPHHPQYAALMDLFSAMNRTSHGVLFGGEVCNSIARSFELIQNRIDARKEGLVQPGPVSFSIVKESPSSAEMKDWRDLCKPRNSPMSTRTEYYALTIGRGKGFLPGIVVDWMVDDTGIPAQEDFDSLMAPSVNIADWAPPQQNIGQRDQIMRYRI